MDGCCHPKLLNIALKRHLTFGLPATDVVLLVALAKVQQMYVVFWRPDIGLRVQNVVNFGDNDTFYDNSGGGRGLMRRHIGHWVKVTNVANANVAKN